MEVGERSTNGRVKTSVDTPFHIDRPLSELEWNRIVRVPQEILTPLAQVRDVFEEIDVLADSIGRRRLLHPLNVGYLDREHCEDYLRKFNHFWKTDYQISNITPVQGVEGTFYCPIIAGGRRNAAITYLKTTGCTPHRQQFGDGSCYHLHAPDLMVQVTLEPNISFEEAFEIQMNENTHMRVSSQREAKVIEAYFRSRREEDPNFKPSEVARALGRHVSFITRALKYVEAPIQIQRAVEEGHLPYSVACELSRLREVLSPEELLLWASKWDRNKYRTVDSFARAITEELSRRKLGQLSMESVFFEGSQVEAMKEARRRAEIREQLENITELTSRLHGRGGLHDVGVLDKRTVPYHNQAVVKAHLKAIEFAEPWLGSLRALAAEATAKGDAETAQEFQRKLEMVQETKGLLEEINEKLANKNGRQAPQLVLA